MEGGGGETLSTLMHPCVAGYVHARGGGESFFGMSTFPLFPSPPLCSVEKIPVHFLLPFYALRCLGENGRPRYPIALLRVFVALPIFSSLLRNS